MDDLRKQPAYGKIEFLRLNFDTETEFRQRYRVPVRSAILLFKRGREVERITGESDRAAIEALVRKAL